MMTEPISSYRPAAPTDLRSLAVGAVSTGAAGIADPGGLMPPVTAVAKVQDVALQHPSSETPRRVVQATETAETAETTTVQADLVALQAGSPRAASPSGVDQLSLFRSLVSTAKVNEAEIPGGSSRLYAMVQQLFSMVGSGQHAA